METFKVFNESQKLSIKTFTYKQLSKIRDDNFELLNRPIDKDFVEQMKFDIKYKLIYPPNYFQKQSIEIIGALLKYSDRIHSSVLYVTLKDLLEIDLQKILDLEDDFEFKMNFFNQQIMEVVIEDMERLYYFYEDEVFSSLVFDLCCLLDLNPEDYGFIKDDGNETN